MKTKAARISDLRDRIDSYVLDMRDACNGELNASKGNDEDHAYLVSHFASRIQTLTVKMMEVIHEPEVDNG